MRVLGSYLASVAAALAVYMLTDAVQRMAEPPVPVSAESALALDWISVAITLVMAMLLATAFALPAFLLCLAVSVRAGSRHPALHVACGAAVGLALGGCSPAWSTGRSRLHAPGPSAAACTGGSPCATGGGWTRTPRRSASAA
ncbi:hypothetical protein Q8W71_05025 [Methylobacterium sp. NEAU 140]|uniref:hypothetical protein n=1 Tax=Methylobacterium sp. NEAU 140 TaxID=3064945 RepID=UPI0027375A54|nr:hypothetical protein [Methylobacterium sp. NEAU 140]MDP4021980.1 hypothetical protein [Methylobacterium sp. NEAU 140]